MLAMVVIGYLISVVIPVTSFSPHAQMRSLIIDQLGVSRQRHLGGSCLLEAKKKKASGVENKPVRERKVKDDKIEVDGVVREALPNAMFRVEVGATNTILLCTISGKIRKNFVKILVGDAVKVELSPYDLTRGRITYRERNN